MKKVFNILVLLLVIELIYICYLNMAVSFDFTLFSAKGSAIIFKEAEFVLVTTFIFALGFLAGILFEAPFWLESKKELKEYKRKLEKTSVRSDEDTSRVAVLEAKIQTLEKALTSALEKNND